MIKTTINYIDVIALVLILSSFSWSNVVLSTIATSGFGTIQLLTRIIPLTLSFMFLIRKDKSQHNFSGIRNLRKWPYNIYILYIFIALISGSFSIAPSLAYWKSFEIFVLIYWVSHLEIVAKKQQSIGESLSFVFKVLALFITYTLASALMFPSLGVRGTMHGIPWIQGFFPTYNPNTIGTLSAILLIAYLLKFLRFHNNSLNRIIVSALLIAVICSFSRTAYLSLTVAYTISLFLFFKTYSLKKTILILSFSCFFLIFLVLSLPTIELIMGRNQETSEILSLSGRIDYWLFATQNILNSPWFGDGIGTGSRSMYLNILSFSKWQHKGVNVHNSFLEILLGAGLVGGAPIILSYFLLPIFATFALIFNRNLIRIQPILLVFGLSIILLSRSLTSIEPALFSINMMCYLLCFVLLKNRHLFKSEYPDVPLSKKTH